MGLGLSVIVVIGFRVYEMQPKELYRDSIRSHRVIQGYVTFKDILPNMETRVDIRKWKIKQQLGLP